MSGGKGGSTSSSGNSFYSNTSSTQIPDWVTSASQGALQNAQTIAQTPYESLSQAAGGNLTAAIPYDTWSAWQDIRNMQGMGMGQYGQASNALTGMLGNLQSLTPDQQNAITSSLYGNYGQSVMAPAAASYGGAYNQAQGLYGQALGGSAGLLSPYMAQGPATAAQVGSNAMTLMSPYEAAVVNPTLALGSQQLAQNLQTVGAGANQAGAYGGTRQGVMEGVAQSQAALGTEQYIGNLLASGYNAALNPAAQVALQGGQQGYGAAGMLAGQGMTAAQQLQNQLYGSTGALSNLLGTGYNTATQQGQQMANTNLQAGLTSAQQLPGLLTSEQTAAANQNSLLEQAGTAQQQQGQADINAALTNYMWSQYYPQMQQNTLLSTLGSIPYGTTTSSSGYGTQSGKTQYNPSITSDIGAVGQLATGLLAFA